MSITTIELRIRDFIATEFLGGDDLTLDAETPLLGLGVIDSLNMVILLAFLESEYGVVVSGEMVTPSNFESIHRMATLVASLVGQQTVATPSTAGAWSVFEQAFNLLVSEGIQRHRFTTTRGESLHYLATEGNEPTWVLLPGMGTPSSSWGSMLQMMTNERCAIAVDYLGFGPSQGTTDRPTHRQQLAAVLELVDAVVPGQMIIVGNSAGALVATELARRRADRVAALVVAGFGLLDDPQGWWDKLVSLSRAPEEFLHFAYYHPPKYTPNLQAILEHILGSPAYLSFLEDGGLAAMRDAFNDLSVPTLIVGGQQDGFFPPPSIAAAVRRVPGAHMELLARCGHFAPIEQPSELLYIIDQFLRDLGKNPAGGA